MLAPSAISLPGLRPSLARARSAHPSDAQIRAEMLVSTDWLAKNLKDPSVFVIQVATDRKNYDEGHIPGARLLPAKAILTTRNGVANELPDVAELQKVFERLGVGDAGRIAIYGENSGLLAARAYFTLDYLGHGDRAALLDGGIEKWKAEKLPVDTTPVEPEPAKFTPRPQPQIVANLDAMRELSKAAANSDGAVAAIIDSRPAEQYLGNQTPRSGHIPGAVNVYWMTQLTGKDIPSLKSADELRRLKPGQKAVAYCNSGMQASPTYFTLKYLGYDAMMYDGSFSEWSKAEGTPVVTGKEKSQEKK
jgi:thiosulfate/3-mercaptopyruvate sulfurtransferase